MTIDEAEKIKSVVENKKYIEQLVETVSKTLVEAFENIKIEDIDMFRLGYNNAIDDFANTLKQKYSCLGYIDVLAESDIDEIAKQLKAGDVD